MNVSTTDLLSSTEYLTKVNGELSTYVPTMENLGLKTNVSATENL